ncbi:maleylpyruvate isomerase N-terminal domain-containing protein [Actinomadura gamaensis]|uniref:Maleylpyruvate isomerase N-terminal domain-containing protein n=1 Tax=Actinomadura gamaensis TaxID=1763541 RepID=A0ABV9TT85_9ACTN
MERTPPDRERVLECYQDGVRAIRDLAARVTDWSAPTPCTEWQALDLAGHLRCVAESYLEYLQDAPDSRLAKLFAQDAAAAVLIRQQARQNAAELAVLPPEPGPGRITSFTVSAGAYADLMPDMWDRTHLVYRGTKYTVGDHVGAACVEWHLHAWDLARAMGADYRPKDPGLLVSAWHWGVPHLPLAAVRDGARGEARGDAGRGDAGREDAWEAVLRSSGRSPVWPEPDPSPRPQARRRVRQPRRSPEGTPSPDPSHAASSR